MPTTESTYYGFTKVREMSPETQDWAATDSNWELVSKILKAFEGHAHTGVSAVTYPGFHVGDPTNPTISALTERTTDGGILYPGITLGVRVSYVNDAGLETEGSPEARITLGSPVDRPLTPVYISKQTAVNGIPGGTYVYGITKVKGTGESLVSDILPIDIPYDGTYSVTLQFDKISGYTDTTDKLYIYRSAGLSSSFSRVGVITDVNQTQFTDANTIDPVNVNIQPPSVATFDATKSVKIDWSAMTHPAGAKWLRVYVTQEASLWGTSNFLKEIDLTVGTPDSYAIYLGNEALGQGWPRDTSQVPGSPPKVNLALEATGGLALTASSDFAGNAANNFKFGGSPSTALADGMFWYDASATAFKGRINGTTQTLAQAGASYVHSTEDQGGHVSANLRYKAAATVTGTISTGTAVVTSVSSTANLAPGMNVTGSGIPANTTILSVNSSSQITLSQNTTATATGVTLTYWYSLQTIFDRSVSITGNRKQVQGVAQAIGAAPATTQSQTPVQVPDMAITLAPDFDNQWIEIDFNAHMVSVAAFSTLSVALEIDGTTREETIRSYTSPLVGANMSPALNHHYQLPSTTTSYTIRVLWWTDTSEMQSPTTRRTLVVKKIY